MIRRPPRSTLFPTRRSSDLASEYGTFGILAAVLGTLLWLKQVGVGDRYVQQRDDDQERAFHIAFTLRSEEHTSELQSRQYLVCRLLLEKKNMPSITILHGIP